MFDKLKRWVHEGRSSLVQDRLVLMRWAQAQGLATSAVSGQSHGLVIEFPALRGRLEWGPSQRPYIAGHELRWRAEGLPGGSAQMVCLTKALAKRLEVEVFDRFTDDNKTLVDDSLPDEMRWLAMLPKAALTQAPALQSRFAVMCAHDALNALWSYPQVLNAMSVAAGDWWSDDLACVLTHNRGWLTLRLSAQSLSAELLDQTHACFAACANTLQQLANSQGQ